MFRKLVKWLKRIFLYFFLFSVLWVITYRFVPVSYTPLMAVRSFQQWHDGKPVTCRHNWISIKDMPINIQKAVIASEDGHFSNHNGFDWKAIKKAYEQNQTKGRKRGGSTISQQTAKNVFLWQGKSYFRKGLESYFTVLIEIFWSKERIMEVYLNSIEMGDGVYGIEAASQYWFNKNATRLTDYEAASIAAILPNPLKFKAKGGTQYTEKRKRFILRQMRLYNKPDYLNE